jgi:Domain of unknown function (DUF3883)
MSGSDWSDGENDLIVADYFDMLVLDLAQHSFNKAERYRNLAPLLNERTPKSVEFKHQNISAVMRRLGEPRIQGLAPLSNYQRPLADAVLRRLEVQPSWQLPSEMSVPSSAGHFNVVKEPAALTLSYPPTLSNAPAPVEPPFMAMIARKYDVAARDERNRDLGRAGEERVVRYESDLLKDSGRHDLAKQIVWTSKVEGDGAGYDIASFEPDGKPRLIEVKTTNGWERTPFHISRNELAVADQLRDHWCLVRLWDFARQPKASEIRPPLDAHVTLTPTSFLASIQ